jgi:hypothetical protein
MSRCRTTLLLLALCLSLAAPATAGSLGDLFEQGGFVDAKLGDPIESFVGLERVGTDPEADTETYVRHSDVFNVGGANVDAVTYSFYQGRLYFISIRISGVDNAQAVLGALTETFGESFETGNRPNERVWTGGDVFVLFDLDDATGRGLAAMTSTPIHARMRMNRSSFPARPEYGF